MQYIENDMDDLFKKAGENYPLQTGGADWNALQAKLAASAEEPVLHSSRKPNRKYLWLLLLLLLPLAAVWYGRDQPASTGKADHASASPGNGGAGRNIPNENNDITASRLQNSGHPEDAGTGHSASSIADDHHREIAPDENKDNKIASSQQIKKTHAEGFYSPHAHNNADKNSDGQPTDEETDAHAPADAPRKITDGQTADKEPASMANGENDIPVDSTTAIRQPKQRDSVSINTTEATAKIKPVKSAGNKHGLYYGVLVGPDISTIKSQKVTGAGYSAGGLLGYRINRHWAIEAGVLWDQKKYYTDGEYFNKTGSNIPPNVTVHSLDGTCNMLEFPLAVRYDVSLKKNSLFFTGGLTSYVMKKENYDYKADNNGNYYEGFRSYKNSGNSLFSNLQLSAGYNYNFSKTLSLRIEPYIKLPVKDIGIGKMPISSKGLYIGIFRNIR